MVVTELTYDIPIEFPIKKEYQQVSVIRGDDVTLRFTQPSSEDWVTPSYAITVYDEITRDTLASTPFSATTTTLVINNFNYDTKRALIVVEDRDNDAVYPSGTMTVTGTSAENDFIQITYDGVQIEAFVNTSMTTDQIATAIVEAVNNSASIKVSASAVGSVITYTSIVEGADDNGKTVTFGDANSTGVTVSGTATLSGGVNRTITTYKTVAHINFVVFDGGATSLTNLGFAELTLEDGSTATIPYFNTGFEVS